MILMKKCCCFDVRTGGTILGWLGLMGGIMNLVNGLFSLPTLINNPMPYYPKMDDDIFKQFLKTSMTYTIGGGIVGILANWSLLWGIHKNKRLGLVPWLVTDVLNMVILAIAVFIIGMFFLSADRFAIGIGIHLIGVLIIALSIYFWCCVLSIYNQIKLDEQSNIQFKHEEGGILVSAPMPCDAYQPPPPYKSLTDI